VKKVTATLDEDTAKRARVYEAAYRAWRKRKPFPLKGSHEPYPKREDLYGRPMRRLRSRPTASRKKLDPRLRGGDDRP
jgi:hypothetical protein